MKVLVDTPIWSYAFRSKKTEFAVYIEMLKDLIINERVLIIGVIQ